MKGLVIDGWYWAVPILLAVFLAGTVPGDAFRQSNLGQGGAWVCPTGNCTMPAPTLTPSALMRPSATRR